MDIASPGKKSLVDGIIGEALAEEDYNETARPAFNCFKLYYIKFLKENQFFDIGNKLRK